MSEATDPCVFCSIVHKKSPAYIVYEDDKSMAFLDAHPQTYGHLQLIPKEHFKWIYEVPYMGELFATSGRIIRGIIPVLGASHATVATYGHQIAHAHIWLVPQYRHSIQNTEYGREDNALLAPHALTGLLRDAIAKSI